MGHVHTVPDSVLSGSVDFLDNAVLACKITGSVAAGELCTLLESGNVVRTDPTLPWSAINQSDPEPFQVTQTYDWQNTSVGSVTIAKAIGACVRLYSGIICVPVQTTAGVGFSLRTAAGVEITNFILVSSDVSVVFPFCIPRVGGGFHIYWHVSATLKVATYDDNGNLITSATVISAAVSVSGAFPWHDRCQLQNSNHAVVWGTTGGALVCLIHDPSAAVVVAQFTIEAGCSPVAISCTPCANGDFLVSAFDTSHNSWKCYRVTNTGSVSWGPITRLSGTTYFGSPDQPRSFPSYLQIFELAGPSPNPYFVWAMKDADGYCKHVVHDHLGNLIRVVDIGSKYHDSDKRDGICWMPQGFCVAHGPSSGRETHVSFFDWTGRALGQNILLDAGGYQFNVGNPNVFFYPRWTGSAIAIARYAGTTGAECRFIHCDVKGNRIGTPYNVLDFGADDICSPVPCCGGEGIGGQGFSDGLAQIVFFKSTSLIITQHCVKVGRSSIIGVAQASATNEQAVTVVGKGYFELPATQVFPTGSTFDQRQAPVPGCRGVVGHTKATLFGWAGSIASPTPVIPLGPPS